MGFVVKNTIIKWIMELICPYTCRGCGELGEILCECCKKYIKKGELTGPRKDVFQGEKRENRVKKEDERQRQREEKILMTRKSGKVVLEGEMGRIREMYVAGAREEFLGELVKEYKYKAVRDLGEDLGEILAEVVPCLVEAAVVPLPTIRRHIRERGFDHMRIIGEKIAEIKGWEFSEILERKNNTVQVGANEEVRKKQAEQAYRLKKGERLEPEKQYILVDDVWTTGASMRAAAEVLWQAGARKIIGLVVVTGKENLRPI